MAKLELTNEQIRKKCEKIARLVIEITELTKDSYRTNAWFGSDFITLDEQPKYQVIDDIARMANACNKALEITPEEKSFLYKGVKFFKWLGVEEEEGEF